MSDHYDKDAAWIAKDYPMVPRAKIVKSSVPAEFNRQVKVMGEQPRSFWGDFLSGL